jgi:hypothetical protein
MRKALLSLTLAPALAGCALFQPQAGGPRDPITGPSPAQPAVEAMPAGGVTALGGRAERAEALDTTSAAEKAEALAAAPSAGERQLGRVVVALGPPAETGLWLATALVDAPVEGRIETAAGQSLTLELRPASGAALMSLAGYQALGLPLTSLPEVTVFAP